MDLLYIYLVLRSYSDQYKSHNHAIQASISGFLHTLKLASRESSQSNSEIVQVGQLFDFFSHDDTTANNRQSQYNSIVTLFALADIQEAIYLNIVYLSSPKNFSSFSSGIAVHETSYLEILLNTKSSRMVLTSVCTYRSITFFL